MSQLVRVDGAAVAHRHEANPESLEMRGRGLTVGGLHVTRQRLVGGTHRGVDGCAELTPSHPSTIWIIGPGAKPLRQAAACGSIAGDA
jgi:hypothetical protein